MIEVNNIFKIFGGNTVLKDVSASFDTGKTNLIIGQSGSGKTVLLKSIVGLHKIDRGEIFYDRRSFTGMDENQRKTIRKEMGMLFQGSALFDSKTVEENVRFPLDVFTDMAIDERRDRANDCLQRVNLKNVNHLYP
ncbi:MAG: ABC transporter ATP-binding protein, partial [Marinilabiliaceae bacterium]